jgi:hypothetical protein
MIVDESRQIMGVEIEANFFSRPEAMGLFEFRSAMGNRYTHFTVRRSRTHQRNINVNAPNISSIVGRQQLPCAAASTQLAIENNESFNPVQYGHHSLVRYQNY